jgi:hypothetical protein
MWPLPGNGYSALPRIRTLSKRWLAMDVCSASGVPTFRQHAAILLLLLLLLLWFYSTLLDLGCCFFSFLIFYVIGRTFLTGDQLIVRLLPAYRTAETQNNRTQTSMLRDGFELKIKIVENSSVVRWHFSYKYPITLSSMMLVHIYLHVILLLSYRRLQFLFAFNRVCFVCLLLHHPNFPLPGCVSMFHLSILAHFSYFEKKINKMRLM